jgi:hypothetical protein
MENDTNVQNSIFPKEEEEDKPKEEEEQMSLF